MKDKCDISVIITAHREGLVAGVTAKSALNAIAYAKVKENIESEIIVIFDKSDEVTIDVVGSALRQHTFVAVQTDFGDPGMARNHGISLANGRFSSFLDGDDLWSENWLSAAYRFLSKTKQCIAHSACNLVFGNERKLWWHVDSTEGQFDANYLEWSNYWDAMSIAETQIYREHPFYPNNLKLGFGHEDWHWNALTIAAGIPHRPVPNTMHFKRRRAGSQMALVEQSGSVRWPLRLRSEK